MTHVVREVNKVASKVNKKEIVDPVTIIETPPMVAVGVVGYSETPKYVPFYVSPSSSGLSCVFFF